MSVGWACFRNYVAHAEEIGGETTDYPRFFIMPESSHVFSDNIGNNVIKLMNDNDHIDHEVELVIKLGQGSAVLGTWTAWDEKVKEISLSVNDELRQCAKTSLMVHDIESLLFHLKRWYDLSPGDYIWTGTPKGVGTLKIGDRVNASLKNNEGIIVSKLDAICIN